MERKRPEQLRIERVDIIINIQPYVTPPGPNSDPEDGSRPGQVTSASRRPSLLTARRPPSSRVHTPPLASPSIAPPDLIEDGGASSTPKRLLDGEAASGKTSVRQIDSFCRLTATSPSVVISRDSQAK